MIDFRNPGQEVTSRMQSVDEPSLPPVPQALFLDAGNTVVFLDHGAVRDVLSDEGCEVPIERLRAAEGTAKRQYTAWLREGGSHEDGWFRLVGGMLREAGVPDARAEPLTRRVREVHDVLNLWRRVPEGLPEALDRVQRRGVRLAIISNSEGRLPELFEHVGLSGLFEVIVDSAHEGVCKPDPRIFRRALGRLGVAPEQSCYVGDLPEVDVEGARSVGMHAVLVDPLGFHEGYDRAPRVPSVADLIDRWLERRAP
ncbi:MAG: HAD family hydrolase [Myxococcota bacterium]